MAISARDILAPIIPPDLSGKHDTMVKKTAAKPKAAKPKAAKPKATKPKATKPKAAKPKAKAVKPSKALLTQQHGEGFLGKIFPVLGAMGL